MKTEVPDVANVPTLHLVCGKIAAGKSTLTAALASQPNTVLISEGKMLAVLYPGEIQMKKAFISSARARRNSI